jgi:hypothetical protein
MTQKNREPFAIVNIECKYGLIVRATIKEELLYISNPQSNDTLWEENTYTWSPKDKMYIKEATGRQSNLQKEEHTSAQNSFNNVSKSKVSMHETVNALRKALDRPGFETKIEIHGQAVDYDTFCEAIEISEFTFQASKFLSKDVIHSTPPSVHPVSVHKAKSPTRHR